MMNPFTLDLDCAQALDNQDPLRKYRRLFEIQGEDPGSPDYLIYLDGNSLGRLPKKTVAVLERAVRYEWGQQLIRSWGKGWFRAPQVLGDKIARLVGAQPGEVVVSDSTSVNLYKLVMAALTAQPDRPRIVSDGQNFPSDLYILQGCIRQMSNHKNLYLVPSRDGIHTDLHDLMAAIDGDTAVVVLSLVTFKSGFLYDAARVTAHAEKAGAFVIWDLSHAVGVVPVELGAWGAHLAVGCTYKYLNGGPGAPAFLYVRGDFQNRVTNPVWGWFGAKTPFTFDLDYTPAEGIGQFLCGTPPMLSLLALDPGLELVLEAGIDPIRQKSLRLSEYLLFLFDQVLTSSGFQLGSPRQPDQRGAHISLRHPAGYQINRALIEEMNLIPDFREPDNIRLGLAPLVTSFTEVWYAVQRIRQVIEEGRYKKYPSQRLNVT